MWLFGCTQRKFIFILFIYIYIYLYLNLYLFTALWSSYLRVLADCFVARQFFTNMRFSFAPLSACKDKSKIKNIYPQLAF